MEEKSRQEFKLLMERLAVEAEKQLEDMRHTYPTESRRADFRHVWRRLTAALIILDYIDRYCREEAEIYEAFSARSLSETIEGVEYGASYTAEFVNQSGLYDLIVRHFDRLVDGIAIEDFPIAELEIMRQLGSQDPYTELELLIVVAKTKKEQLHQIPDPERIHSTFEEARDYLYRGNQGLQDDTRPRRRWFKQALKIGKGTGLMLGNAGASIGLLPTPLAPLVQLTGPVALLSCFAELIDVLDGVDELRSRE